MDYALHVVLTADVAVLCQTGKGLEVLLVQRGKPPYEGDWALPGGKLDVHDLLIEQAACREVYEETGVQITHLQLIRVFSEMGRDPRGRYVSVLYVASVAADAVPRAGGDALQAVWCPLSLLPSPLAFDHERMIAAVLARL